MYFFPGCATEWFCTEGKTEASKPVSEAGKFISIIYIYWYANFYYDILPAKDTQGKHWSTLYSKASLPSCWTIFSLWIQGWRHSQTVELIIVCFFFFQSWFDLISAYIAHVKDHAHGCVQSLGGVRMTNSEGLWPQLVCCTPHLSTVPLISDKVQ